MNVSDVIALLRYAQEVYPMENGLIWMALFATVLFALWAIPACVSLLDFKMQQKHREKSDRSMVLNDRINLVSIALFSLMAGAVFYKVIRRR